MSNFSSVFGALLTSGAYATTQYSFVQDIPPNFSRVFWWESACNLLWSLMSEIMVTLIYSTKDKIVAVTIQLFWVILFGLSSSAYLTWMEFSKTTASVNSSYQAIIVENVCLLLSVFAAPGWLGIFVSFICAAINDKILLSNRTAVFGLLKRVIASVLLLAISFTPDWISYILFCLVSICYLIVTIIVLPYNKRVIRKNRQKTIQEALKEAVSVIMEVVSATARVIPKDEDEKRQDARRESETKDKKDDKQDLERQRANNDSKEGRMNDKNVGPKGVTPCKFGDKCYRKNAGHKAEFWHPKK